MIKAINLINLTPESLQIWTAVAAIAAIITAFATIAYMFITRAILLNTNRQDRFTTLLNYFIEIKKDYGNINPGNLRACIDALIRTSDLDLFNETSFTSFRYVASELSNLIERLTILNNEDKTNLITMIKQFYYHQMADIIVIIIELPVKDSTAKIFFTAEYIRLHDKMEKLK